MTAHGIIRNHQRALRIDSASIQTKDTISNPTLVVVGHGPLSGISHFSGGFCVFCNPISSIRQSYRGTYGEDMRSCKNWTATTLVKTTPPAAKKRSASGTLAFKIGSKWGVASEREGELPLLPALLHRDNPKRLWTGPKLCSLLGFAAGKTRQRGQVLVSPQTQYVQYSNSKPNKQKKKQNEDIEQNKQVMAPLRIHGETKRDILQGLRTVSGGLAVELVN